MRTRPPGLTRSESRGNCEPQWNGVMIKRHYNAIGVNDQRGNLKTQNAKRTQDDRVAL